MKLKTKIIQDHPKEIQTSLSDRPQTEAYPNNDSVKALPKNKSSKVLLFQNIFYFLLTLYFLSPPLWGENSFPPKNASISSISFDTRPEWLPLFNKEHLLAHLIETNPAASSRLDRSWLEKEIAPLLGQSLFINALRQSILKGEADLYDTMLDSLLSLNLPADYARTHLMEWILGSESSLRTSLLQFPSSPAIRTRFTSYLLQQNRNSDLTALLIQKTCDSQNRSLERILRKQIPDLKPLDWSHFSRYPQLTPKAQLEFRWLLFRAHSKKVTFFLKFDSNKKTSFSHLIWNHLLSKIDRTPALLDDYQRQALQRVEPEQWTREALTDALRQNHSDLWFQSYLHAAQIPNSRYQAVFLALTQTRREKRARPELIAESSQERAPWRARLVQLIQNDLRWSAYFLWHLTRAAEPITILLRRSLPALFAQQETLTLEWYRWSHPSAQTLSSASLKNWGIRWGELLRDRDSEWKNLWSHHDLSTQALLQKTVIASLESNPPLVTTWVAILQSHQPSLKNSFALWTQQNSPHPEMSPLPVFMNRLTTSIQRKEWVGNLDLALFRVAFSNYLRSQEGWNQVSWRIGLESFQIAQPLRELLLSHWSQHPKNFWKLLGWRALYSPQPQAQQKILDWIRNEKISEKSLLSISKQNSQIQIATHSLWINLFQNCPPFQQALDRKRKNPTQQDDLDQLLASIDSEALSLPSLSTFSPYTTIESILLRGGEFTLADWILRQSELQKLWITELESKLTQDPHFLKQVIESLQAENQLSKDSFSDLIQLLIEDRLFFETVLSDPSLGFKNKTIFTDHDEPGQ